MGANMTLGSQYELSPRGMIYRRDAGKVGSLEDLKKFLRSNDYLNDQYSGGDPTHAVCARGDLKTGDPIMLGCYDTKVSNLSMFWNMTSDVINGPTSDGVPAFSWKSAESSPEDLHFGQPDTFDFKFERMAMQNSRDGYM